jgi:long-subunit fatty acid transport protein
MPADTVKKPVQPRESKWDKLVWGGYLTLQVGTVTIVAVSPQAGYYVNPRMLVGAGLSYEYYSEKWYNDRISSSIYGGRVFNEYAVFTSMYKSNMQKPNFSFISHIEYELINLDRDFSNPNVARASSRFWIHGLLVGGGYKQHLGRRSSFNFVLLYNIINDSRSPYDNPQIRIGFYF